MSQCLRPESLCHSACAMQKKHVTVSAPRKFMSQCLRHAKKTCHGVCTHEIHVTVSAPCRKTCHSVCGQKIHVQAALLVSHRTLLTVPLDTPGVPYEYKSDPHKRIGEDLFPGKNEKCHKRTKSAFVAILAQALHEFKF